MAEMDPHVANARLWSAYIAQQWESWLPARRAAPADAPARRQAWPDALAAAWTSWLTAFAPRRPEDRR